MARPVLDPAEQRVLGALMEKERTVPASYPLSLNALRTACNQSTSREPLSDYSDAELEATARGLKARELLRVVWAGKGSRTLKYHQLLSDALELAEDERALLTVLLLRGAQSAGELRTRTERLFAFGDREGVEACLGTMANRTPPLVVRLERRAGQQDPRWLHLLGPVPEAAAPASEGVGIDREVVLAQGPAARTAAVRVAYDAVADSYAEGRAEELNDRPFDRWLLERIPDEAPGGPLVEVGCGPGHIAAFLADAGAEVTGIDLSPAMIERARATYADLTFAVGDAAQLLRPPRHPGWAAIVAWDAVGHLAASELPGMFGSWGRTLIPGGWFVLAVEVGHEVRHVTDWWGHAVDLTFVRHDARAVRDAVAAAGLRVAEWYVRGPVGEEGAERLFVLARRP
ncbi:MAG: DUF480 domain-containing protein [Propionibacteriaceae bacterium]|nr:DUF480 domain-containing protein [Propionibacteriaceae bacterium]